MRIAMAVVGAALLCTAALGVAQEQERGDGLACMDRCDASYQSCMRWRRGKGSGDCPGGFVRCRDACSPPAERAAAKRAEPPPSCREACQADFDTCMKRDNGRHTDTCAKTVIVCRNGCPPEASSAAAASVPPARTDATQSAAPAASSAATAPAAPAAAAPPPASARSEEPQQHAAPPAADAHPDEPPRAAAPAPAPTAATPRSADAIGPAAGKVPPSAQPRSPGKRVKTARVGAAADGARSSTSIAPTADHAPSSAVAGPASADGSARRPSAWSRAWCALTGSCGARLVKGPVSCDDACTDSYTECIAHEDPKRGGECATSSLRCHQDCAEHKTSGGAPR